LSEAINIDYSFIILRCPFKRLASVFLDKFVAKEPETWTYRELLGRSFNLNELTFRDFVLSLSQSSVLNSNIHWRPQSDFILYKEYSDYFSLENFDHAVKTLQHKIGLEVIDARNLTEHDTRHFELVNDKCHSNTAAFDIAIMKRNGQCPSHEALYDRGLYEHVRQLYSADISFYKDKFGAQQLMAPEQVRLSSIDIETVQASDIKTPHDVDFLRDEAIRVEDQDIKLASKLMSLAYEARPEGPFIAEKHHEYKSKLNN
jgi:hypothetical protein